MGQGGSRGAEPIPQGQQEGPNNPEATWWCKLFARLVGGIGGVGKFYQTVLRISLIYSNIFD